jgi:hypothetical protein
MLRSLAAVLLIASTLGSTGAFALVVPDDCASPVGKSRDSEGDDCERNCLLCACCVRQPPTVTGIAPSLEASLLPTGLCTPLDPSLPPPLPSDILHVPKRS